MGANGKLRHFEGAVALITGGASGIGRAFGEELARGGAHPILADRQVELAEEVAEGIRQQGGQATAAELDVRDFGGFEALAGESLTAHGRIDYLFNNAGLAVGGEVSQCRVEDWYQVLDVNLRGVIHGVHAVYPHLLEQGFGHIVNTASVAGLLAMPTAASYCASKHAVVGISKSLRLEAAPSGVRVSALCPGAIRTPILKGGGKFGAMREEVPDQLQSEMWEKLRPMDPAIFAVQALRDVVRNKAFIVVPRWWRAQWWLYRLSPSLSLYLSGKVFIAGRRRLDEYQRQGLRRKSSLPPL